MNPRTKAGADLASDRRAGVVISDFEARIRRIEDEMLDKVAEAVEQTLDAHRVAGECIGCLREHDEPHGNPCAAILAAIQRIREEASDGR